MTNPLNDIYEWLDSLGHLSDCDTEIADIKIQVTNETSSEDKYVHQTIYVEEIGRWFKRNGRKQFSYDEWVETEWGDWSET